MVGDLHTIQTRPADGTPYINEAQCDAAIEFLQEAMRKARGDLGNGLNGLLMLLMDSKAQIADHPGALGTQGQLWVYRNGVEP